MNRRFLIIFLLTLFTTCRNEYLNEKDCVKFKQEIYKPDIIEKEIIEAIDSAYYRLLRSFNEPDLENNRFEAYQIIYFSSFGECHLFKFEHLNGIYHLKTKQIGSQNNRNYEVNLKIKDWIILDKMIHDFQFWTETNVNAAEVLDGYSYFIEGTRPQFKNCTKRTHRLLFRRAANYDLIESLCENIQSFVLQEIENRYDIEN